MHESKLEELCFRTLGVFSGSIFCSARDSHFPKPLVVWVLCEASCAMTVNVIHGFFIVHATRFIANREKPMKLQVAM